MGESFGCCACFDLTCLMPSFLLLVSVFYFQSPRATFQSIELPFSGLGSGRLPSFPFKNKSVGGWGLRDWPFHTLEGRPAEDGRAHSSLLLCLPENPCWRRLELGFWRASRLEGLNLFLLEGSNRLNLAASPPPRSHA